MVEIRKIITMREEVISELGIAAPRPVVKRHPRPGLDQLWWFRAKFCDLIGKSLRMTPNKHGDCAALKL
jgi:hypothetical protein